MVTLLGSFVLVLAIIAITLWLDPRAARRALHFIAEVVAPFANTNSSTPVFDTAIIHATTQAVLTPPALRIGDV